MLVKARAAEPFEARAEPAITYENEVKDLEAALLDAGVNALFFDPMNTAARTVSPVSPGPPNI